MNIEKIIQRLEQKGKTRKQILDSIKELSNQIISNGGYNSYSEIFHDMGVYLGVPPKFSKEVVQKEIINYLKQNQFDGIRKVIEITKQKPVNSKELESEIVHIFKGEGSLYPLYYFLKENRLKINIPEDVIKEKSSEVVRKGDLDEFEYFERITKTKINFNESDVVHGYKSVISRIDKEYLQEYSQKFIKKVGYLPKLPKDFIQMRYVNLIENINKESFYKSKSLIDLLEKNTGYKPKFPEKAVQKKHLGFFQDNEFYEMNELSNLTGIKANIYREILQDKYNQLIEKNDIQKFKYLYASTGIKPKKSLVQEKIRSYFDKDEFWEALDFSKLLETKVKFPEKLVQEKYFECLGYKKSYDFQALEELIKIEPDDKVYCEIIRRYFNQ